MGDREVITCLIFQLLLLTTLPLVEWVWQMGRHGVGFDFSPIQWYKLPPDNNPWRLFVP
jgi:hypothetical protein